MSAMHLCAITLHFEFAYNVTRIRNCVDTLSKLYVRSLISYFNKSQQNISNRISF